MAKRDKPDSLTDVTVVLVGTSHAGNIGAAARAMKTMGLSRLVLVAPRGFPSAEATARAAGADDVLAGAAVVQRLEDAVSDRALVLGTSARSRHLQWPELTPREAAERALARRPSAIVFGRERSGLSNEELDRCQALIRIPTAADYASLNLAAAVQLLAYELRLAALASMSASAQQVVDPETVTHGELEGFYAHLDEVLVSIGYLDPEAPKLLRRRLRRLFNRATPDRAELNILRGILSAVQKHRGP